MWIVTAKLIAMNNKYLVSGRKAGGMVGGVDV